LPRVVLIRRRTQEELYNPLWLSDRNLNFVVSVIGSPGDTRMRIGTPKGRKEIGFPFVAGGAGIPAHYWHRTIQKHEKDFRQSAVRELKEMGYNAKIEGKKIVINT